MAEPWRGVQKQLMSKLAMTAPVLVMLGVLATAVVGGAVIRLADALSQRAAIEATIDRGDDERRRS